MIERVLTLYVWALICVLLLFLYLIARFYQRTTRERSHYRLFLIPLSLFSVAGLRYAWTGSIAGEPFGDLLLFAGGVGLFGLGFFLYRLMMGRRR